MNPELTQGAIQTMTKGDQIHNPVMQVINTMSIVSVSGYRLYRLLLSDRVHTSSSFMLAAQLNDLVEQKEIAANCICRIKKYIVNTLKDGRHLVKIIDLEVLKSDVEGKIGEPAPYVEVLPSPPSIPRTARNGRKRASKQDLKAAILAVQRQVKEEIKAEMAGFRERPGE